MARGCTPGLVRRWSWWSGWDEENGYGPPPEEGDIAIQTRTGSCYLVLSVKPSRRKGAGWFVMHVEGLGVDVADIDDEGTFGFAPLTHEDYETIRLIEHTERVRAMNVSTEG